MALPVELKSNHHFVHSMDYDAVAIAKLDLTLYFFILFLILNGHPSPFRASTIGQRPNFPKPGACRYGSGPYSYCSGQPSSHTSSGSGCCAQPRCRPNCGGQPSPGPGACYHHCTGCGRPCSGRYRSPPGNCSCCQPGSDRYHHSNPSCGSRESCHRPYRPYRPYR